MSAPDSEFYSNFRGGMAMLGLPAPETLFGSLGTATATIGAMANAVKTIGTKASIREIMFTAPLATGGAAAAAGVYEIVLAVGAMSAAFYAGACVGCLLGASVSTYGISGATRLWHWIREVEEKLGGSINDLLRQAREFHPRFGYAWHVGRLLPALDWGR